MLVLVDSDSGRAAETYASAVPARVRDFLYLDPSLVAQTLSQLDFGVFKDWQETLGWTSSKEGGLGVSLWGAASVGGRGQRSTKTASEVAFEQTAESYASRLLFRLEEEDQLLRLEPASGAEQHLRRGTVVAVEGELEHLDLVAEVPTSLFGGQEPDTALALHRLGEESADKVAVVRVASFAVVASWLPENLRVTADELIGEVEIVGIVRRTFSSEHSDTRIIAFVRPIAVY